jgi:hypothetical protein
MQSTREDVEDIIGEVDAFILERILAVGASKAELQEAALVALVDYEMGEQVSPISNPRVVALCGIIEGLLEAEEEENVSAYPPPQRL